MLERKHFDAPIFNKRKALLVGAEPSVQGLISTFLVTMGWTCTVAAQETVPDVLQRELIDAVLINLGPSVAAAEQAILKIKEIRPSLADRILVINNGLPDREIAELIERHDLVQVSQDGLLQQLWSTLQDLVAPPRSRETIQRGMQIARLVFDSFRYPLPGGVRSSSPAIRQVAYQYKQAIIDLSVDFTEIPGRISLAGQVLDGERKGKSNEDLPVLLVDGTGTLMRTSTNQFGEFQMEFESADDLSVQVRLGERSWVLIPLGKMDWAKKLRSNLQAGN